MLPLRLRLVAVAATLATMITVLAGPFQAALADLPPDYDIPNGHFFTQTNTAPGDLAGYAVTNESDVPLWNEFRRLGGITILGYPISRRFTWDGFTVQAFQKAVLQWRPQDRQAWLVNVFDLMHDAGKDAWLRAFRSTPPSLAPDFDSGKQWSAIVRDRLFLLDDNPAIKKQYFAAADPLSVYGLPQSRVLDNGNHFVVRFQRAVMQQWKSDVPWAKAGQVTVANGGAIASEAGLLPPETITPDIPPLGAGRAVVIDPGHGGAEIGAAYRFPDGTTILEKDLNLRVGLKVADLLRRAGYKPILTRQTDTEVNKPPRLLTARPPIGLDDELQARIAIANNSGAKLFLSIHFNGHPDSRLHGSEVYYCKERPFAADSRRFAALLLDNLGKGLATIGYHDTDAAVKDDSQALGRGQHYYLLGPQTSIIYRPSQMPAALAEGLFVTNSADATALRVGRTLDVIARAYATAVHQYFTANGQAQLPLAPPSPPPAPPPSPIIGQGTVATELGNGASMRSAPAITATIVAGLPEGAQVDLLQVLNGDAADGTDRRWYRLRYAGVEGYVYAQLIRTLNDGPTPPAPILDQGTVATELGSGANMRSAPANNAAVLAPLPEGAKVDLLQVAIGDAADGTDRRWYRLRYAGAEGYVYAQLIRTQNDGPTPPAPTLGQGTVATSLGKGANMRSAPATNAAIVGELPEGGIADLLQLVTGDAADGTDRRWYGLRYAATEGYVYAQLIRTQNSTPPPSPSKAKVNADSGGGAIVRAAPRRDSGAVHVLANGTIVTVIKVVDGEVIAPDGDRWYLVGFDGGQGYIWGGVLDPQ